MKKIALMLAAGLLAAACSSSALHVDAKENVYLVRRSSLQEDVVESLKKESWTVAGDRFVSAVRAGEGMHKIILLFTFTDLRDRASFELNAKSGHTLNWLTFGLLGRAHREEAAAAAQTWLAHFREAHKSELAAPPK